MMARRMTAKINNEEHSRRQSRGLCFGRFSRYDRKEKVSCTHPIAPITGVVAVRVANKVVHIGLQTICLRDLIALRSKISDGFEPVCSGYESSRAEEVGVVVSLNRRIANVANAERELRSSSLLGTTLRTPSHATRIHPTSSRIRRPKTTIYCDYSGCYSQGN